MDNKTHYLVNIDKACRAVIDFIGTDEYNKVISSIEDTARAGFTAGLSFAMCLTMSTDDKYVIREEEKKQEG